MTVTDIKRLNRDWRRRTRGSVSVALVSLSNPFNVGSIYRTAATLGADTVYLIGATPTALEPKVRKTSLGTEKAVQTVQAASLAEVADQVRAEGGVMTAVGPSRSTSTRFRTASAWCSGRSATACRRQA
jgi:tRNA (guanosine-2'-O-)-methyltransferase